MENTDNKKPHGQTKDHSTNMQGQPTTPVNLKSGDKLRENPSNDEETIAQNSRKTGDQQTEQTPLSREHDGGRNQVTNEDEQKEIVNPTGGDWDQSKEEPARQ